MYSTGLEPRPIHSLAIRVMDEIKIDISAQESKGVDTVLGKQSFKHAIFVCERDEENSPSVYPFALEKLSWPFEDPAAFEGIYDKVVNEFRQGRDQIDKTIQEWLKSVTVGDENA